MAASVTLQPVNPEKEAYSYTIHENKYGVLVTGSVPINDLLPLMKAWSKRGLCSVAPGVTTALGATMAVTHDVAAWEAHIEEQVALRYKDPAVRWYHGPHTGNSSLFIYAVMKEGAQGTADAGGKVPVPTDADDFSRAYRLLVQVMPEWEARIQELAVFPAWKPFCANWPALKAVWEAYRAKKPTRRARKEVNEKIKALLTSVE